VIELLQLMVLAVVQGLTEFLPVSSSGHLVLLQHAMGVREGDALFNVVLHCGTLGSVLVVYRREVLRLLRFDSAAIRYLISLAVATLPAVVVGLLASDLIVGLFGSPRFAAGGLILTALVLFSSRLVRTDTCALPEPWEPLAMPLPKALMIGLAQSLAILPGVSRSGSTIGISLWLGVPRAEAARFSFLLSVPAIAGALVLSIVRGEVHGREDQLLMVAAAVAAFGVGLLAIRWTALAVVQDHFWKFGFYCLALGILVFALIS